eukprot:Plantae.Rhodophyta-Rhodochaete_pulchella.ctg55967.p1 GENE.Plantae.Rhodophyta-Rhodochaete_pulchella.ctg55967~~Plantae.Rhodophyta-Rhodochaete_pulchella.ctg55967.p1  ORF type:complete len:286 (+),score=60.91 Plantae.Rhodophyta-Rhodochaete_pulchella.ctg55967:89-859(+)
MPDDDARNASVRRKSVLPLSKIKKIAKIDEDIKLIRADAVELLALATERFLEILTEESYRGSTSRNRLTYSDVAKTIDSIDAFNFISEVVPLTNKGSKSQIGRFFETDTPKEAEQTETEEVNEEPDPELVNQQRLEDREAHDSLDKDSDDGDDPPESSPVARPTKNAASGGALETTPAPVQDSADETEDLRLANEKRERDDPMETEEPPGQENEVHEAPGFDVSSASSFSDEEPAGDGDDAIQDFEDETQPPPLFG